MPSNIAGGAGRNEAKECFNFVALRGSLTEQGTQLQLAVRLDFTNPNHAAFELIDRTGKLLTGLQKKLNLP
ncbi:MAG: four helix bundle protein [Gallionellaceae bacterium]